MAPPASACAGAAVHRFVDPQRAAYGPPVETSGTGTGPIGAQAAADRQHEDEIRVERWGEVPYAEALDRQLALHACRVAGHAPDTLVLVAHPPTFTLGRHAPEADIVLDAPALARRGIAVARSDRGGRATYHGPGQVVLYPIVSIDELGLGVKDWVCLLESALIDTLADYGIAGERRPGTAGIWTKAGSESGPAAKIASLGLRISRGVSYHGVALNTGLDASVFDCIVTCGVAGERVTTIAAERAASVSDEDAAARLAGHVAARLRDARQSRAGSCATSATKRRP